MLIITEKNVACLMAQRRHGTLPDVALESFGPLKIRRMGTFQKNPKALSKF